ncbi:MAG: hypothetical protein H0V62_02100 [Gammaproteobacteria bacterium]|nr:hypothetical protein [Gammaproteobacteria bacterium]
MSELDLAKEKIAYLKLWLGIMVVTDISLVGWFATNYVEASNLLLILALGGVLVVAYGIYLLHRRIERKIVSLREM